MRILPLLIALHACAHAEILRLSLVAPEATDGYTLHEFEYAGRTTTVFVKDEGFLSEANIKSAKLSPTRPDGVDITLKPEGTKKMIAVTGAMRPGIDRIAILLDGRVFSAPVVQSVPLGKYFAITGLTGEGESTRLAARLTGKTEAEITRESVAGKPHAASRATPPPTPRSNIIIKIPSGDVPAEDADLIAFVEKYEISLKPGEQAPSEADYLGLASALLSLEVTTKKPQSIDPECDMIETLALRLPELKILSRKARDAKIPLKSLKPVLKPFVSGENLTE